MKRTNSESRVQNSELSLEFIITGKILNFESSS